MTRIGAAVLLGALVLSVGGCGEDDEPATGSEPTRSPPLEFTKTGGCGDAFFWATTADDEHALVVTAELHDRSTSEPTVLEAELPDAEVEVELWEGEGLTSLMCNDLIMGEVTEKTPIEQGSLTVTLQARPRKEPGNLSDGKAELTGLATADGTELPDLAIRTTTIGFYAG
jgi:hypothetical protein